MYYNNRMRVDRHVYWRVDTAVPVFAIPTDAPAVKGPPQGHWTYDDWDRLDSDHNRYRYEVIDGWLYVSYVPPPLHQGVVGQLSSLFGSHFDRTGSLLQFFYV